VPICDTPQAEKAALVEHQMQHHAGLHLWRLSGILPYTRRRHFRDDGFELTKRIDMARKKQRLAATDSQAGPLIRAGLQSSSILQKLVRV